VERFDVIVVGGGPVGLGTALAAARRGMRCLVLERESRWPVDKACGEGVLPRGVELLEELGVELPAGSVPLEGIRYVEGPLAVEAAFTGTPGLGVRRLALSEALRARAAAAGVTLRPGTVAAGWEERADGLHLASASGPLLASWLVGADGLASGIRERAGIRSRRGPRRFGVRRHYRCAPWTRHVEVHWADGLEAYVTPVAGDCVGVALLGRDCGGGPDHLLRRFPELRARLGPPLGRARGAGPFDLRVARRIRGRVALVGDAAGYVDPLTGEGVALGLAQAESLAAALAQGRPGDYERAWPGLTRRHRVLTRMVLVLAERPALRRRALRGLAKRPGAFQGLLAFATHAPRAPGFLGAFAGLAGALALGSGAPLSPPPPPARPG
jgi:flavin-dependent dehydrogenase